MGQRCYQPLTWSTDLRNELVRQTADATADELVQSAQADPGHGPDHQLALLEWRGALHLSRWIRAYPQKPYIVVIRRLTDPLAPETAAALRRRRFPVLKVHPKVEFTGHNYVLGLSGQHLCLLSGEDFVYCLVHPVARTDEPYSLGYELVGFDNP
jgi:hypothetical protein